MDKNSIKSDFEGFSKEDLDAIGKLDLSEFNLEITPSPSPKNKVKKVIKKNNHQISLSNLVEKTSYNALELYNFKTIAVPKLLDPFLQTVGLASLVGTSDCGKSTFLRQLSLSIVLNIKTFLDFELNCKTNRVIYVSTEDDSTSISYSLRKQITGLKKIAKIEDLKLLENLEFLFDTHDLLKKLSSRLEKKSVDLIVIDAFADVFSKEINANTQVRNFLNDYDRLAKKHGCLILFLHHIGKRATYNSPSKDSIIGTQAYEAKMRVVLEIRPRLGNSTQKDLWVLKSNFLETKHKTKSYILDFDSSLTFKNTGQRGNKQSDGKSNDTKIVKKVLELHKEGLSTRKIETQLKNTEFKISKSSIAEIIKKNKVF